MTRITVLTPQYFYPVPFFQLCQEEERDRGTGMTLGMMAVAGLVAAAVLIVVAITLINKFAN